MVTDKAMRVVGIIPARYCSTRLPGKPLIDIGGKPMIQRVYEQAARALTEVWVATDDIRIARAVEQFGGNVLMTSDNCRNGTDRCAEAAGKLQLGDDVIIINVQGDQPFIDPGYITELEQYMLYGLADIATAVCMLPPEDEHNPSCVKAYVKDGRAQAFDRYKFDSKEYDVFKHIGIYAYRHKILRTLASLDYSDECGSLEQTAWLSHYHIYCVAIIGDVVSIDTAEDLIKAEQILKHNG